VLLSIPLGIISAVKKDTIIDHLSRIFVLSGVSIPNFWLGLILIYLFYAILGWSPPPMGRLNIGIQLDQITGFLLIDSILTLNIKAFLVHLII
jgi:peptide/nickel transport system permease protein